MGSTAIAEERRTQIIEAALRVLLREGITEATTRKITAEAGVNGATLNYYFGSKDNLLMAVLEKILREGEALIWQSVRTDQGLRATIENYCRFMWSFVEQTPQLQLIQYELSVYAIRHPPSSWLVKQQYEWYCRVVEAVFRAGSGATSEADTMLFADLAQFVVAAMDGLLLQSLADRDSTRAKRGLERLITAATAMVPDNKSSREG
jgi:AcrR family transcriptional regulator